MQGHLNLYHWLATAALVTIVAIILAGIFSNQNPGMNAVLIVGITAVVIIAVYFSRPAEFATPGADKYSGFPFALRL